VALPVHPPLAPMLARLSRDLPRGDDLRFEPKWDGFRCLAFRDGDQVDLRSRNNRPLARYFPEVVEAVLALADPACVLDGELVTTGPRPFDFSALMLRLHPSRSRVERLRTETPAAFVAFDAIVAGERDLRDMAFDERRRALAHVVDGSAVTLTPSTADRQRAVEWLDGSGAGIDGVVVKPAELRYQPGKRAMLKVKQERTVDCVVGGVRLLPDRPAVSSLLLGLYEHTGALVHVGVVGSFTAARRVELLDELAPFVTDLPGHPWEHGFRVGGGPIGRLLGSAGRWTPDMPMDWVPLRPERVCEVAHDQVDDDRFRHPARFRRWRPDRDPASCRIEQLRAGAPADH
jgi:ATP-dependent DNA ligase